MQKTKHNITCSCGNIANKLITHSKTIQRITKTGKVILGKTTNICHFAYCNACLPNKYI